MPFEKGHKLSGSRKGVANKVTQSARDCLTLAAEELGGTERVVAWVKEDPANERVFWSQMYTKLVGASGGKDDPFHVKHALSSLDAVYGEIHTPSEAESDT